MTTTTPDGRPGADAIPFATPETHPATPRTVAALATRPAAPASPAPSRAKTAPTTAKTAPTLAKIILATAATLPTLAAAAAACAPDNADDPFADAVVAYDPGANPAPGYTTPETALGSPERFTGEGVFPGCVTPFNSAFGLDEIVSIGSGGALTLAFDTPVTDDPANPFGVDLIVFGNALFIDAAFPAGEVGGLFAENVGTIELSADGVTWVPVPDVLPDGVFPTIGYADATPYQDVPGTVLTDFTKPVDPAMTMADVMGMSHADLIALYDGSGGGAGVDIGAVGLASVSFIRISNPDAGADNIEIDAVADVAPAGGPPGDLNRDGAVDASDLAILLAAWGVPGSPADLDGDGTVDAADLAILLANWTG